MTGRMTDSADESSRQLRGRWEARYADLPRLPPPSEFLVRHAAEFHGRVLDVACGSGRNAVYLARRGIAVEAIDQAHTGLRQLQRRAAEERLDVQAVQADLTCYPLPVGRYDGVLQVRYLQRDLFPALIAALRPGGVLLIETFLVDQRELGHPRNPAFLLERGELRASFRQLRTLAYEEGLLGSGASQAFLARLLAQRAS